MTKTAFPIESIPLPSKRFGGGRPTKYPFGDLKKGQCFKVPDGNLVSLSGLGSLYKRKLGRTFTVRTLEGGVVGVWRVK